VPVAVTFGGVHRHVGAAQHLERVAGAVGVRGTDARGHQQLVRTGADRLAQRSAEQVCRGHRIGFGGVGEQHGELVAAHPGDQRAGRHRLGEAPCQHDEQPVADGVAEVVVYLLEAVQVQQEHLRPAVGQRLADLQRELAPVGQPGQVIAHGQVLELVRLPLDLRHETGHPQDNQQEQHESADRDGRQVVLDTGHEERRRSEDRARGEQQQPAAGHPGRADRGVGGSLGPHRGMQGGGRPDHVRHQPEPVQPVAGVVGVQRDQRESDVGDQQQRGGDPEQPGARGAPVRAGEDPGEQDQQQGVRGGVGRADRPLDPRDGRVGGDRVQHEDPEDQPESGGHDRGVHETGQVAAAAAADQPEQADHQHRVGAEIEDIGERRVRLGVQDIQVVLVHHVADHPEDLAGGEPVPDPGPLRAVHPDGRQDHQAGQQADHVVRQVRGEAVLRDQVVATDGDHTGRQPDPPESRIPHDIPSARRRRT
jgi:hypothetical protein